MESGRILWHLHCYKFLQTYSPAFFRTQAIPFDLILDGSVYWYVDVPFIVRKFSADISRFRWKESTNERPGLLVTNQWQACKYSSRSFFIGLGINKPLSEWLCDYCSMSKFLFQHFNTMYTWHLHLDRRPKLRINPKIPTIKIIQLYHVLKGTVLTWDQRKLLFLFIWLTDIELEAVWLMIGW